MTTLKTNLSLSFEGFSLQVEDSVELDGITALFGSSGAGKTTLLRVIAGLEDRATGHLSLGGEIWQDTEGRIDMMVTGVGTGGTITGVTRYIRQHNPDFKAIAVEPAASPVISGGRPAPHQSTPPEPGPLRPPRPATPTAAAVGATASAAPARSGIPPPPRR